MPPTHLEIVSDQGVVASNSVIGPYKEGSSVNITCMSGGGKCLVSSRNDPFLHTITSSSPFHFLYGFYGRIYIILLYIYTFIHLYVLMCHCFVRWNSLRSRFVSPQLEAHFKMENSKRNGNNDRNSNEVARFQESSKPVSVWRVFSVR